MKQLNPVKKPLRFNIIKTSHCYECYLLLILQEHADAVTK